MPFADQFGEGFVALPSQRLAFCGEEFDLLFPSQAIGLEQLVDFIGFLDHRGMFPAQLFQLLAVALVEHSEMCTEFRLRDAKLITFGGESFDRRVVALAEGREFRRDPVALLGHPLVLGGQRGEFGFVLVEPLRGFRGGGLARTSQRVAIRG